MRARSLDLARAPLDCPASGGDAAADAAAAAAADAAAAAQVRAGDLTSHVGADAPAMYRLQESATKLQHDHAGLQLITQASMHQQCRAKSHRCLMVRDQNALEQYVCALRRTPADIKTIPVSPGPQTNNPHLANL